MEKVEGIRQRRGWGSICASLPRTHFITGSQGPTRAVALGGIRYWKDGHAQPDVLLGLFDYPQGFNLQLRVNFVNGGPEINVESYAVPQDYSDTHDQFTNFFEAVRNRTAAVQDPVFGYRAVGAALLANLSLERGGGVGWDPEEMKLA